MMTAVTDQACSMANVDVKSGVTDTHSTDRAVGNDACDIVDIW